MNTALQEAIREAYVCVPSSVVIHETLQIRQTGVQSSVFLVRSIIGITAKLESGVWQTFEPCGFKFTLPPTDGTGAPSVTVQIDNVGRRVLAFIEAAKSSKVPVELLYRPYISTNLEVPQMNPPLVLFLKEIQVTSLIVTGRATFMDLINRKFPSQLYTRDRFPTLG
jgi:hypothetical protein